MVEVEITKRARQYGYLFWKKPQDEELSKLLGKKETVEVVFMNAEHGKKNIDWRYRRISIGWRWTRSLPDSKQVFVLKMLKSNKLDIQCR